MQWIFAGIVAKVTPLLSDSIGPGTLSMVFTGFSLFGFLFMGLFFRESKGKTLKEVEESYVGFKCNFCN